MPSLRRGSVVLSLTLGLVLIGCTDIETPDARTVGPSPVETAKHPQPVVIPDVPAALGAVERVVAVMFPPTTTTTTTTTTTVPQPTFVVTDGDYHSWPDWPEWQRLGRCEQPNDAYPDGIWWDRGGAYEGGLGILNAAWSDNNAGLPAHGNQASPGQQITVARRILARFGWSAWSCAVSFGW